MAADAFVSAGSLTLEYLERTHADMGRTCKLHIVKPLATRGFQLCDNHQGSKHGGQQDTEKRLFFFCFMQQVTSPQSQQLRFSLQKKKSDTNMSIKTWGARNLPYGIKAQTKTLPHTSFLVFCSLKFHKSCRKSNMRQQAVPHERVAECEYVHRASMSMADRQTESAPHSSGVNHPFYPQHTHTLTDTYTHTHTHTQLKVIVNMIHKLYLFSVLNSGVNDSHVSVL